jgi:hypothetical protein
MLEALSSFVLVGVATIKVDFFVLWFPPGILFNNVGNTDSVLVGVVCDNAGIVFGCQCEP